MNLYFELLKIPVFKVEDVNKFYSNVDSARSAIKRLMKEKLVAKIRNNLYTCISGETGLPIANRFQVACSITPTAYISHHTAMEYYGITDQIFYEVYVSSETSFRAFEFDGYTFRYITSRGNEGIYTPVFSGGIRVTNPERTLIDCIKDMDKISGMEEVIQDISCMKRLQEKRLLSYLERINNKFLYQKTGYLLSDCKEQCGLSEDFFKECRNKIGKSKRYLSRDLVDGVYDNDWKLVVPRHLNEKNGVIEDAAV